MSSVHASGRRRRPGGRAVAATALALGVAAVAGYLVAGTGAQASNAAPAITANPPEPPEPPEPPPPPPTRLPLPTVPQATLVLDPGPGEAPSTTASPTTTTEENATTSTVAASTSTAPNAGDASAPAPSQYTVTVTHAEVSCDGTIHVEYDTVAIPEPPAAANHLVVFNPSADPADFHVVETTGNPANGSFTFEQLGQVPGSYRLFVVAAFDPINPAGPLAVDQADVLPAPGC